MRKLTSHQRSVLAYLDRQSEPTIPLQVSFACNSRRADWSRQKLWALANLGLARQGPPDRYGHQTWLITPAGKAALTPTSTEGKSDRA